ncbi:MAG: hypothetical protein IJP13_08650 [Lachnospiraceae bacterium]|nr:hypothetical protein [Lachnospiraceae bacterium]
MEKLIKVGSKNVRMRASALIPRLYRFKFGRDIVQDMAKLKESYDKAVKLSEAATEEEKNNAQLSVLDLTLFENIAYIMAFHADSNIPPTPEEWLEEFDTFSIYEVLPVIMDMWRINKMTTATPKKKLKKRHVKAQVQRSC